jgi:hypothetical protein
MDTDGRRDFGHPLDKVVVLSCSEPYFRRHPVSSEGQRLTPAPRIVGKALGAAKENTQLKTLAVKQAFPDVSSIGVGQTDENI